ncbi:MAG TPA: hypothetical protein VLF63_01750 [Patescibacteria group bacterium]|nr:hypothetical protein [Patescibacteria group bacterium]
MLKNKHRNLLAIFTVFVSVISFGSFVNASGTTSITQSYNAGTDVLDGMVVELSSSDSKIVVPLKAKDINKFTGVVVPLNQTTLSLSTTISSHQVLVASSGRQNILVSNQNGNIKIGDYLSISSVSGVAMKANGNQSEIIGQAASNYSGSKDEIGTLYSQKNHINVSVGLIPTDIKLTLNPLYQNTVTKIPRFVTKIANGIVNKNVSPIRIYLSIGVFFAILIIVSSIFFGGVHSGITAIGRNPLAKKAINRGFLQTLLIGLILFILGIFAIYIILL